VTVRRLVLLLLALGCVYLFVWVPWRPNRVSFLVFIGFGMIQLAGTYISEADRGTPHFGDHPPLFQIGF